MGKVIEAIYKKGVFKPLEKVDLKDGEIVEIEIKEKKIGEKFYRVLEELKKKAPKVHNAFKVLEEVRNDLLLTHQYSSIMYSRKILREIV